MDRWTMQELKETDDLTFAICILEERRKGLTRYSPLGMKLKEAAVTLSRIKDEQDKYMAAICEVCSEQKHIPDDGETTDLSDVEESNNCEDKAGGV